MQQRQGSLTGAGGVELFTQSWLPDVEPRASLIIVHGFGEHSGRYSNVVDALVPQGYAIHSFDLRGHGRSQGRRGHVVHWSEYEEDTRLFIDYVRAQITAVPIFLFGHSLGGLIVLTYGLRHPSDVRGIISSAPALAAPAIAPILLTLSQVLSRVWASFSLSTGLDATSISRIPEAVRAYQSDPLVHDIGTARIGTEMASAREWALAHASDWHLPLLIVQGSADRLVPTEPGHVFFERVQYPDKELRVYPGAYHEVHNDLPAAQEMADITNWLERHLDN